MFGPQYEFIPVETDAQKKERLLRELTLDVQRLEENRNFLPPDNFASRIQKLRTRIAALKSA